MTGDRNARISSGLGNRAHPLTGKKKFHNGIDIAVPTGTIVIAAQSGTVTSFEDKYSIGEGNHLRIDYDDGPKGAYLHLWTLRVRKDDTVSTGQIIANADDTGGSAGPHLHYSIWRKDHPDQDTQNPDNFLDPEQHYGSNCGEEIP